MTCREVMTHQPSCCLATDSVATAAQIMKQQDVGPVLVVTDHSSQRLAGIVTDRDLAVKLVAEGRNPNSTQVHEVMSPNPITCREDEPAHQVLEIMARHQVRRVPVIDAQGRLCGIISQADLARYHDQAEVGEMVEEISEPSNSHFWSGIGHRSQARRGSESTAQNLALGALCLGLGAGFMYLFDSNRGRSRRNEARDRASSLYKASGEALQRTRTDLLNRAQGAMHSTKSWLQQEESVSDQKLEARVRSRMGRCVSHPHAVHVTVANGTVTLSGAVLREEVPELLNCIHGVRGVQNVEDHMQVEERGTSNPSLQGGKERVDREQSDWTPRFRVLAGAAGGGLLLYGVRSRGTLAKAGATIGAGLLARGIMNAELSRWVSLPSRQR